MRTGQPELERGLFVMGEGIVEESQRPESWLSPLLGLNYHQSVQTNLSLFCLYVTAHLLPPDHTTQLTVTWSELWCYPCIKKLTTFV